jgi:hypothetical protein
VKSFREHLRELQFADLNPRRGEWKQIPVSKLKQAQSEPPVNIDTELFNLLDISYAYIGGHVDFQKPSDIPSNHTTWFAVDVDGDRDPDAVKFGKETPYGMKWTGGATDGTPDAKQTYLMTTAKALQTPGNYCEVSDAIMHIMITHFKIPCVNSQAKVEKILGKKVNWIGAHPHHKYPGYNGFYSRTLGGVEHMKLLIGKPR